MTLPLRLAALTATAIAAAPTGRGWYAAMERAIAQGHTAAWLAGTAERLGVKPGGALLSQARLSRAERADIKAQVAVQLKYLEGFAQAREGMSEAAIKARAELYALSVQATYHAARWGDWELPWVPCDGGSECLGRCKCSASVADNGDGTGTYTWTLGQGASEQHCATCPGRAGDHPVRRRGAATKQTAQDRAMFANMGSSGGGGGGGGGSAGGKPTGGTGGLWAKDPATGKRTPEQGLEKGAAPPPAGSERAQAPAARQFKTAEENDKLLRGAGLITDKKMTQTEKTSLQWYHGVGHDRINEELRGVKPVRDQYTLDMTTRNLDSAMERSRLTRDVDVSRGMLLTTPDAQARVAAWQPGTTFRDPGYVSTTASRDVAAKFGAGKAPRAAHVQTVDVRVHAPAGTPAIYMPTAAPLRGTAHGPANEYELLLGRNLSYRVVGRSEENGRITVDLEVVP